MRQGLGDRFVKCRVARTQETIEFRSASARHQFEPDLERGGNLPWSEGSSPR
jgi:hypothetical protein